MTKNLLAVLTISLAVTAPGCLSEQQAAVSEAQDEQEGELGVSQQAISGNNYSWSQGPGITEKPMELSVNSFCFLTRIAGKFEGSGEWVRVDRGGDRWVIRGASEQQGLSAQARCVPSNGRSEGRVYSHTQTLRWDQGQPRVWMGPTSDRVCFLMGVKGNFNGAGERVELSKEGGNWWLGGSSATNDVSAWAACLLNGDGLQAGNYSWYQGEPTLNTGLFSHAWACGLTKMQGHFQGSSEYVQTLFTARPGGYQWALTGGSQRQGVAGAMACAF